MRWHTPPQCRGPLTQTLVLVPFLLKFVRIPNHLIAHRDASHPYFAPILEFLCDCGNSQPEGCVMVIMINHLAIILQAWSIIGVRSNNPTLVCHLLWHNC